MVSLDRKLVNDDITGFTPVITGVDTRPVVTPVSPKPVAQSALAQVGAMMFNQATTVQPGCCGLVLRLRSETYFCEIIKKSVSCVSKSVHPEQIRAQNYARAKHVDIKIPIPFSEEIGIRISGIFLKKLYHASLDCAGIFDCD